MSKVTEAQQDKIYFEYLDNLRTSGRTNMLGAAIYLRKRFGFALGKNLEAMIENSDEILQRWVDSKA